MSNLKSRTFIACFFFLALMNCSATQWEVPLEQWPELLFIVDGRFEIRFVVPPAKVEPELFEPQFISTLSESTQTMLVGNYDPGKGRDRSLLLTRITATVIRIEKKPSYELMPSLDYIKNEIYLARADAEKEFDIVGAVPFNDQPWLRVNLISGYRRGISYSTLIDDEYVLILSMTIFGENSDKKRLYRTRHATLRNIVNSTKITIE